MAIVPRGQGPRALEVGEEAEGRNMVCLAGTSTGGEPRDVVIIHVANARVEHVIDGLQAIPGLHLTILPQAAITLYPPEDQAPDQVTDVTMRSPIEIFLGGLQSIGSWKGFLGYAAAAGAVAWIGMHTNAVFLLVAAMLIAPFAGPAVTLALGTARGDRILIGRSVLRYFASLAITIGVTFALSLTVGQEIATELMINTSEISAVTVLLPLVAGAAGALNLSQSERNSLVTAAGPGVLVAASLAPPAALIGMGAAIGEWDLLRSGGFVLLLQLVGINLSGAATFWLLGLTPRGVRYDRGQVAFRWISLGVTAVTLAALLGWQFSSQPALQRSTQSQRAAHQVQQIINESDLAQPVEVNARFTRADIGDQNTLLVVAYVQRSSADGLEVDADAIDAVLTERIGEALARDFNVTPVIDITVLDGP